VELLGAILAFLMFITSLGLRRATASGIVLPFAPTAIERHMRHRIATTLMQICCGLQFTLRTTRILLSTRVDNAIQQMGGDRKRRSSIVASYPLLMPRSEGRQSAVAYEPNPANWY